MRILWITNTVFPAPSRALHLAEPVFGGWMYGLAEQLIHCFDIKLAVAAVYPGREFQSLEIDGIIYYLLPSGSGRNYPKHLEKLWATVIEQFDPAIIHIHGTEFLNGLACMRACPQRKYVVSVQGLLSVIGRYYYSGLTLTDMLSSVTLRDLIRMDSAFQRKKKMMAYGSFEQEYFIGSACVIGRTSWDYAHVKAANPGINYYHCNELLRDVFYSAAKWNLQSKTDHTIFLSQAAYPIKGLHIVIRAVAMLVRDFPNIRLRVAGNSLEVGPSVSNRLRTSGYNVYITRLLRQLDLEKRVSFLGPLTDKAMVAEYHKAHLFICPSSIENSPNSIGEAQLLGVPTIASFVGGIPDMITHGETGLLYRFEEVHMLVESIRRLFTDHALAVRLSSNGIAAAATRHDRKNNCQQMIDIYRSLI